MTKRDQVAFLRNLSAGIVDSMIAKIKAGRVPEDWDGHELRQWVVDYARESAIVSSGLRGKRAREYRNTRLVNNL